VAGVSRPVSPMPVQTGQMPVPSAVASSASPAHHHHHHQQRRASVMGLTGAAGGVLQAPPQTLAPGASPLAASQGQLQGMPPRFARRASVM
jgi:hypothetical protein